MVAAIDELMGNTDWRDNSALSLAESKGHRQATKNDREISNILFAILVPRKHVDTITDAAIEFGAGGANVTYVKHLGGELDIDKSGFAIHHEMGLIRIVMNSALASSMHTSLVKFCEEEAITNVTLFEQAVSKTVHYRSV
jgi:hypothetical protein